MSFRMKNGTTTMVDIYEAAGGVVNEDRTSVTISTPKSFEIVLRVFPIGVESGMDGDFVTFDVVLDDTVVFGEPTLLGTPYSELQNDASIRLPVDQVRILSKEEA